MIGRRNLSGCGAIEVPTNHTALMNGSSSSCAAGESDLLQNTDTNHTTKRFRNGHIEESVNDAASDFSNSSMIWESTRLNDDNDLLGLSQHVETAAVAVEEEYVSELAEF
jgi:hypothetical protein